MIKRYAVITNGKVDNICLWDGDTAKWTPEAGTEVVEVSDNIGPGWLVDGDGFVPPPPPQPVLRRTDLTANDFLDLFTPTEQATFEVAIEGVKALIASGGTPNATQASLFVVNRRINSVDLISLDDPRIASSLDILVSAGIIQAGRKADIIAGVAPE